MTLALDSRYLVSRHLAAAVLLAAALAGCSSGSGGGGGGGSCTLPQATSLSVAEFTPPSGATGVFVGTNVSVRFNTCLDTSSVTSTSFLVSGPGGFVAGSVSYDATTATLIFDPAASLAYSTLHIVGVTGLRGAHGETLTPAGASFRTQGAPEYVAPTTTASPPGGRYHATQSVTLTCVDNPGGTGCAATYYTVDGSMPTAASTRYTGPVAVAQSLALRFFSVDVQGNAETPKQEAYVIDTVPPTLTGSNPPDGATEVQVTQVLSATFSEPMNVATLSPATVTVDNGATLTFAYASATNTLVITPTERLACNTPYRVSIGAGATDVAGNALVQPATFGFTTATDCVEPVTTAAPPGGVYTTARNVALTCADTGGSGCGRIVYTTDGSVPSLDPPTNGTIVPGSSAASIAIGEGDTVLRYYSEDAAGNREVLRQQVYSVSTQGFTFVATSGGLARGVGPVPASFVPIRPGGRTYAFFRDASNGRLYRGTERGLLYSDGGEAWTFVPASLSSVLSVLAQGSKVFAGTTGGLLVSTDGGATFAPRDLGAAFAGYVRAVAASGSKVYAATDSGLAVSADRGRTFAMRTTANGLGSSSVRDLVLSSSTLYAATGGGVSISTDGGSTFANHATGLASPSVNAIAVSPSTVYAGTDGGLCVSTDGGQNFTVKATAAIGGLGSDYVGELVLSDTTLYLGTGLPYVSATDRSLAISTNGGTSFTFPLVSPSTDPTLRIDSIFVEGSTVRVGAYPAYYLSIDGATSFVPKDLRGSLTKVTGGGTNLYMAVEDGSGHGGVAVSADRGQSFTIRGMEDGLASNSVADVFATGSSIYAATFGGVGISTDGGTSFANQNLSTTSNAECVYAGANTVWAGSTYALEKRVGTGSFSAVQLANPPPTYVGIGAGIATSGVYFYYATTAGLWVSGASGAANSFSLKGAAQGLQNTGLYGVAVDSGGKVLAVSGSSGGPTGFYLSADNGASFTALPGAAMFPYGIYANGTTWYASTSNGLGISTDGGATWTWRGIAEGLPGPAKAAWYMP